MTSGSTFPRPDRSGVRYPELRASHRLEVTRHEEAVLRLRVEPSLAIGQHAHLINVGDGNVLWDCLPLLDDATYQLIAGFGGLDAIAISHPHFYTGMAEWSRAFDDVHLSTCTRRIGAGSPARPRNTVYWDTQRLELAPGATLIHCGGHFRGSAVLHCEHLADDDGAILTGDTVQVGPSQDRVGFMYSYPNHIPLGAAAVRRIRDALADVPYRRVYGAFHDVLDTDGTVVARSADALPRRARRGRLIQRGQRR